MLGGPRPLFPTVLTIAGGLGVLAGGLLLWSGAGPFVPVLGLSRAWFLGGAALGILTVVVGALLALVPAYRRPLGAVALACAVASIPLAYGGLVVGFVLTAIGGAAATTRPQRPRAAVPGPTPTGRAPPWT